MVLGPVGTQVDVYEAVSATDRAAARYTLTADMTSGAMIAAEISMSGRP